jgi:chromate transporter
MSSAPRPTSLRALFWAFTWLALQGFGGVLAVAQRVLVEQRQWLSPEEFAEEWAAAQVLPGPNVVNLSIMLGDRYFGWRGALCAFSGILAAPMVVTLLLATFYAHFANHPAVAGALQGMSAVAAGLIAATGLKLLVSFKKHPLPLLLNLVLMGAMFIGVALWHQPLVLVLLPLAALSYAMTWRRLIP